MTTYKEYHGLTLEEVARITGPNFKGYAVFLLPNDNPNDDLGTMVGEAMTITEIIRAEPALANCIVKYSNDFYGEIVLRVATAVPVKNMRTCKDCIHNDACTDMLESMGYIVTGDGIDADRRCPQFENKNERVDVDKALEWLEGYTITDTEKVYTNGTVMVPLFRVEQALKDKAYNGLREG